VPARASESAKEPAWRRARARATLAINWASRASVVLLIEDVFISSARMDEKEIMPTMQ